MLSAFDPRFLRSDTAARKRARRILLSAAIVGSAGYFTGVIAATLYESPLLASASAVPFLGTLLCCISLFILLTPDPSKNDKAESSDPGEIDAAEPDQEKIGFMQQEPPDVTAASCDPLPVEPRPSAVSPGTDEPSAQLPGTQKEKAQRFTKRERDLLAYLAGPDSYRAIAGKLNVSTSTVKSHARSIFKKTGIESREELRNRVQAARKAKAEQERVRLQKDEGREQKAPRKQSGGAPSNSAPPPRNA